MFEFRGSHRSMIVSKNGMVASSQPLAVHAGLEILQKGGNAIDAAVAVAAALNVVEPMSTGIGGDAFALIFSKQDDKLHALNASGWSPENRTIDFFKEQGMDKIPLFGIHSISVPGAVSGFEKALEKFGTMSLKEVLKPAIYYAEKTSNTDYVDSLIIKYADQLIQEGDYTKAVYEYKDLSSSDMALEKLESLRQQLISSGDEDTLSFIERRISSIKESEESNQ